MNESAGGLAQPLGEREFRWLQGFLMHHAGIHLASSRKAMVCGRLARRLRVHGLDNYADYLRLLASDGEPAELQTAIDLLTTNETYFFREQAHFDFMRDQVLARRRNGAPFRVWSAACSAGDEAYSLAMLLDDRLGAEPWQVLASDLSTRVLEQARAAHYPLQRGRHVPADYLRRYCLKGIGRNEGTFQVGRPLAERVEFRQINLNRTLPAVGRFEVVFLRNVMIYFDLDTKREVLRRLLPAIAPGGYLMIGHSESLQGVCDELVAVQPAVYLKPENGR
ncbi:MAG: protein-glutamate O-methyltransferase CheR [Nevskia sp.]|nr:protein-glutamate O-methyltransferase CheR [Nevskia sp.]